MKYPTVRYELCWKNLGRIMANHFQLTLHRVPRKEDLRSACFYYDIKTGFFSFASCDRSAQLSIIWTRPVFPDWARSAIE